MNNTIVLSNAKVAAELQIHLPFNLLHVPVSFSLQSQPSHFLHSEKTSVYKYSKVSIKRPVLLNDLA